MTAGALAVLNGVLRAVLVLSIGAAIAGLIIFILLPAY